MLFKILTLCEFYDFHILQSYVSFVSGAVLCLYACGKKMNPDEKKKNCRSRSGIS